MIRVRSRITAGAAVALRASGGLLVGLLLLALLLAVLVAEPLRALSALLDGAAGDRAALVNTALKTTPLLLTGLAVAISFRCGVWNIGAEGQLLAGALAAAAMTTRMPAGDAAGWLLPAALAAAALAGGVLAGIAAWLRSSRGVSEVISTLMLNFVALHLVAFAVQGPLQESAHSYPQSDPVPPAARLPSLGRLHLGVAIAVGLAPCLQVLIARSVAGFRMRAVGASPEVSRYSGIAPERYGALALLLAGGLAGLAGAFELLGVTFRLYERISPGYGFTAIAVALLARLQPLAVVPAAAFFGALEAGAGSMQRVAGVPSVVTQVVQGTVILLSVGLALGGGAAGLRDGDAEDPGGGEGGPASGEVPRSGEGG